MYRLTAMVSSKSSDEVQPAGWCF